MSKSAFGVPLRNGEAAYDVGQRWLSGSASLPGGIGVDGRAWLDRQFPAEYGEANAGGEGEVECRGVVWIRCFPDCWCVVHVSQPTYSIRRSVPLWVVVSLSHDELTRPGTLWSAVSATLAATGQDWSERDGCETWLRMQLSACERADFSIDHFRIAWWMHGELLARRPIVIGREQSGSILWDGLAMLLDARRRCDDATGACLGLSAAWRPSGTGSHLQVIAGHLTEAAGSLERAEQIVVRGVLDAQFVGDSAESRMATFVEATRRRELEPTQGVDAWFTPPLRLIDPLMLGDHEIVRWISDLASRPGLVRERFEQLLPMVVAGKDRAASRAASLLSWIAQREGVEAGARLLLELRKRLGTSAVS